VNCTKTAASDKKAIERSLFFIRESNRSRKKYNRYTNNGHLTPDRLNIRERKNPVINTVGNQ
jgi:hypothetical protein